ncbi:hypothetical protein GWK47_019417 [Chionoecetes opilio]|uniref:Uncharacterized protein n=1 Tax=Chionoecetes opilio TaxID=41210 RepID=A0A8J4XSD7_CHIOP|nr:hypothetical protein GWK47_019417 [Chionoecetes opilio]
MHKVVVPMRTIQDSPRCSLIYFEHADDDTPMWPPGDDPDSPAPPSVKEHIDQAADEAAREATRTSSGGLDGLDQTSRGQGNGQTRCHLVPQNNSIASWCRHEAGSLHKQATKNNEPLRHASAAVRSRGGSSTPTAACNIIAGSSKQQQKAAAAEQEVWVQQAAHTGPGRAGRATHGGASQQEWQRVTRQLDAPLSDVGCDLPELVTVCLRPGKKRSPLRLHSSRQRGTSDAWVVPDKRCDVTLMRETGEMLCPRCRREERGAGSYATRWHATTGPPPSRQALPCNTRTKSSHGELHGGEDHVRRRALMTQGLDHRLCSDLGASDTLHHAITTLLMNGPAEHHEIKAAGPLPAPGTAGRGAGTRRTLRGRCDVARTLASRELNEERRDSQEKDSTLRQEIAKEEMSIASCARPFRKGVASTGGAKADTDALLQGPRDRALDTSPTYR